MAELQIGFVELAELERLKPLWLELLEHHASVSPSALPDKTEPERSWTLRRGYYQQWLAEPKAFALLAERDGEAVGYALVSVHGPDTFDDTWQGGEEVAELETLVVTASARGTGAGSELLDRVMDEIARRGIAETVVASVATNEGARRFYERAGFTPYLIHLYSRRADSTR